MFKKILLLTAFLFLAACTGFLVKSKSLSRTPSATETNTIPTPIPQGKLVDPLKMKSDDLTFAELKAILQKNKFSKIEDLLKHLSATKPEYMSHYTLAFESMSLHGSSKENPRAIVYGKTGTFIITFNADPAHDAYAELEVVEFNRQQNIFEYREIEFNENNEALKEPFLISQIGGPPVEHSTAPKCLQCHTESRPIWNTFNHWPGFYGGDNDFPIADSERRQSTLGLDFPPTVKNDWQKFQDSHKVGRYSHLPPMAPSEFFPQEKGPRPNADLTAILTQLNGYRIGQLVKRDGGKVATAAALIYALDCQHRPELASRRSPEMQRLTDQATTGFDYGITTYTRHLSNSFLRDFKLNKDSALNSSFPTKADPRIVSFIATARKLLPDPYTEAWTMIIQENVQSYENGIDSISPLRTGLREALIPLALKPMFIPPEDEKGSANYCEQIRKQMPWTYQ